MRTGPAAAGADPTAWPSHRDGSPWHLQRVADTVHGTDQLRSQLAPQRFDVAVHGARREVGWGSPHVFEQCFAGHRGARTSNEEGQQVEFGSGEVDFVVAPVNSAR